MLKNYFKLTLRNLRKHNTFSLINISGLALGIATCLLILIYVRHELSYDSYHDNTDRIYRVAHQRNLSGTFENLATTPLILGPVLAGDISEIEQAVRFVREDTPVVQYQEKQFIEPRFFFADPAVLEVFSFEMLQGNPETALQADNNIVITERIAQKYFGDANPLGKTLTYKKWGERFDFTVTGVLKNIPDNSHFSFDFLARFESQQNAWFRAHGQDWHHSGAWTYVLLKDQSSASTLSQQLASFVQKHVPEGLKNGTQLYLQPLSEIHLRSKLSGEIETNSSMAYIYVLSAIAFAVLMIACINFMNLATARSATRAKEVGMRKVLGAVRTDLIRQFIGEAMVLSFLAVILAIVLANLLLPVFNNLTAKSLTLNVFENGWLMAVLILLGAIVGVISGSYPAFYLSAFKPVKVLGGQLWRGAGSISIRKILVTGQFMISMVLLMAIGIISNQIDYMKGKDLGFEKEQIVFLKSRPGVKYTVLKHELESAPAILKVVGAGGIPGSENASFWSFLYRPEGLAENERIQIPFSYVDYDFLQMFDIELIEGRNFAPEFTSDPEEAVIINETAARTFGWQENAIGKEIEAFNMVGRSAGMKKVIGVVQDYHFESLHHKVKPFVLHTNGSEGYSHFVIKISSTNVAETINFIEEKWRVYAPEFPLEFFFLDQDIEKLYRQEEKLGEIIGYLTALAVFIACLGLFGLAAFSAEQRTKEIGVRKVLGASVPGIVTLLSKELTKLIAFAFIIAVPVAYLIMGNWLQSFAYKTEINIGTLLLAGFASLVIAWLTVSYQSVKAALANPVESLRYE